MFTRPVSRFSRQRKSTGRTGSFISAENTGTAMHGDHVVARITRDEALRARAKAAAAGPKAASFAFSSARTTPSSARCNSRGISSTSCPDDPRIVHNVYVRFSRLRTHGRRRPRRQGCRSAGNLGIAPRQSRRRNHRGSRAQLPRPGVDMLSIIRKYHLPTEFPDDVLDEAERIPETVDPTQSGRPRRSARSIHRHDRSG